MPFPPGTALGPYELQTLIGSGGMGEVYRARDPKLQRAVAIKVLPDVFVADPERLARFQREAQALAALNHPNIAQVFGVIEAPPALVMELVEGRGLDALIQDSRASARASGLPMAMALDIATQIADAVEAAHERGIIHRDLKPANIRVRDDGTVKVLDFGLAKAIQPVADAGGGPGVAGVENSPTVTSPVGTQMGVILGTAAYMAPEQARGRTVDRRADIWAFGCVLYEMLTGLRPFHGDDVTLTLAAILKEPVDFNVLPPETPAAARRLLRRCLERDPRKRQSSLGDARLELQDAISDSTAPAAAPPARSLRTYLLWAFAGATLAAVALIGLTIALGWRPPQTVHVVRSTIAFTVPLRLSGDRAFALHPAATEIVLVGYADPERFSLYRHRLDGDETTPIAGTEGAQGPFFSPDGRWLGFVQNGRLKKMPAGGGASVDLGHAQGMQGGAFAADGSIIVNLHHGEGLQRIAAGSTERKTLTTVDRAQGEAGHHWPHMLPDGRHVLFTLEVDGQPYSGAKIMLLSLDSGEQRLLVEEGTDARYLPTGHLVYWRDNALWRVPFDRNRQQVTGNAEQVLPGVMLSEANGHALFAVADNGTMVYLTGRDTQEERGLMLVNRNGVARQLGDRRAFETVSVSPDGSRIAVTIIAANDSLWMTDVDQPSFTRLTFESENSFPTWSPDGSRLALARSRGGEPRRLFLMPSDGSSTPELLRESSQAEWPDSWTRHGNLLAYTQGGTSSLDIWVLDMSSREAKPVLATRFNEGHPRFSPDGKWLAYASDESGRFEVYVRPFPGPGPKRLVSNGGGMEPRWRGDGREVLYRIGGSVMAADVTLGGQFRSSTPHELFKGPFGAEVNWPTWDALPSGKGFLLIQSFAQPRTSVTLIQNWFQTLR